MSSILSALKKLEKESARQDGALSPAALDSRRILKRKITPTGPNRRLWVAFFTVLAVAGALFFIVAQWRPPRPVMVTAANKGEQEVPTRPPVLKVENTPPIAPKEAPAPPPLLPPATKAPAGNTVPVNMPKRPEPITPFSMPSGGRAVSAPLPAPAKKQPSPSQTAAPSAPADLKSLPADAGLKLQAMAWAANPEGRFAVINSQIVREGDSVGEVTVERIEQEKVVVRKGGSIYQLMY